MARSSLGTIDPATTSGTALAALLSSRDAAENSGHSGTGRPSYATAGMIYTDDAFSPPHIWLAVGAGPSQASDIDLTLLFSPRPGTIRESAEVRLPSGWLWADGTAVARGTYPDLLEAIAPSFTGTTNGTTTISSVSEDLRNLGLIGAKIEGTDVPAGATITAITSNTITISAAATGSHSGVTLRAFPWGNGNGSSTFNTPNRKGRVGVGRGDMGGTDVALITTGGAGFEGKNLGASGGVQTFQLLVAHLPAHSHSASSSGSTGASGTHTHSAGSYVTDTVANHSHGLTNATQTLHSGSGTGSFTAFLGTSSATTNGSVNLQDTTNLGGTHSHDVSGTSGAGGDHTHTLTISTTVGNTGSDTAHQNTQPSVISNFIVKT